MKSTTTKLLTQIPHDAKDITLTVGLVRGILDELHLMHSSVNGIRYDGVTENGEKFDGQVRSRFSTFNGLRTIANEAYTHLTARGYTCRVNREEITTRDYI